MANVVNRYCVHSAVTGALDSNADNNDHVDSPHSAVTGALDSNADNNDHVDSPHSAVTGALDSNADNNDHVDSPHSAVTGALDSNADNNDHVDSPHSAVTGALDSNADNNDHVDSPHSAVTGALDSNADNNDHVDSPHSAIMVHIVTARRVTNGLGPLGVHLNTEEGVSFQTDNEMFWNSHNNGMNFRLQAGEMKDLSSKFQVSLLESGKIHLQDFRDMYVSCAERNGVTYLEMDKCLPDELCEFEVFHDGEKVMLKASNGLFVCRTFHHHETVVEVGRSRVEECCRFRTSMGDLYPPSFDISNVELDDLSKLICRPCVLKTDVFVNKTDSFQDHEFRINWETYSTDTTKWATTWGLSSTFSSSFPLMAFEATITYNGSFLKTATTHRPIVERRSVNVAVPPNIKVTAQLVVSKLENASIPFKAHVRKTKVDGDTVNLVEEGVWTGLVYDDVTLETSQTRCSRFGCTLLYPSTVYTYPALFAVTPALFAVTPALFAVTPALFTVTPALSAVTPSLFTDTPALFADTPALFVVTPALFADTPALFADTPALFAVTPALLAVTPALFANTPALFAVTPALFADTPALFADTPALFAVTPALFADTPALFADTPVTFTMCMT
ncbi:uncharacterized protein RCH25_004833 [Pelodytes ibericus]